MPQPLHFADSAGLQEVQQQQQRKYSLLLQRLRQRRDQEQRHMSRQARTGSNFTHSVQNDAMKVRRHMMLPVRETTTDKT